MSFAVLPPEINSARLYVGARVGADAGRGGRLGWTGRRIGFGRGLVFGGDGGAGRFLVAGRGVDGDDGSGRPLSGLVERGGGAGPAGGHPNPAGGGRLRGSPGGDGTSGDHLGQPGTVRVAGGLEPAGPKRPGDRGHRGRLRADVGPGRGGDVWLPCRGFGGRLGVDTVRPGAADRGGRRCAGQRGRGSGDHAGLPQPGLGERRRGQRRQR